MVFLIWPFLTSQIKWREWKASNINQVQKKMAKSVKPKLLYYKPLTPCSPSAQ